jgi:hypothetical protein
LTAKTIVLNEVLAYPNPDYPYPANREFIELKNNGSAPVDVAGWKVSEMTGGGVENKYTITTAGGSYTASPYGGSTIIPAGGWLVLLLSDTTAFNNNGDTIRLYDSGDNKLDEYSYEAAKYGLSDARYLDGIGAWVDPIPTPGGPNVLYGEICILSEVIIEPIIEEPIEEMITEAEETTTIEEEIATTTEEITPPEEIVEEPVVEEESVIEEEPITEEQPVEEILNVVNEEPAIIEEPADNPSDNQAGEEPPEDEPTDENNENI